MKKPLIGLTPSHDVKSNDTTMRPTYPGAIRAAGGIPVVLPLEASEEDLQQLVETLDGFLFTGGPDLHPFLYGEETHRFCEEVSDKRDTLEMTLLPLIMKAKKPILGICRGIQSINVALGGTLYQDIPTQYQSEFPIAHRQPFYYTNYAHHVTVTPGTKLAEICQCDTIQVNSMHHQAVKAVAPGCIISGVSSDGLVEAIEMPAYPYLVAVEWHPEYLWPKNEAAKNLFSSFIEACRL